MLKMKEGSKFLEGINKLESAFRVNKLSDATLKVYYEKLKEVDEKVWIQEIDKIIEHEDFFPSIKCLLKYCIIHHQVCL